MTVDARAGGPPEQDPSTTSLLSVVRGLDSDASPELRVAAMRVLSAGRSASERLRLLGRARKVSVSLPEGLTEAVQRRVGRGEFSQYVTEAVARQLELDLLAELSSMLEADHGAVSEEALAEARRSWPDAQ
jgi:Arc/MetJ-type ribon-helix-helix transcriptional regulator